MKKFEEVKQSVLNDCYYCVEMTKEWLEKSDKRAEYIASSNRRMAELEDSIQYIDESTTIQIGYMVNKIISGLKDACNCNNSLYFSNFDFLVSEVLLKTNASSEILPAPYYGRIKTECDYLGITLEDLQCLKGKNPNALEFGDNLRMRVNQIMGTKIPMSGEVERAEKEYSEAIKNLDEIEMQEKYISMMELYESSGKLLFSKCSYAHLSKNTNYQEKKAFVSKTR